MVPMPGRSSPPQLDQRPEATAFPLDDLMLKVRDGKIRIPPFQRGLKWKDQDRLDLFDSIHRGFPIGTLLLWKHAAESGVVQLGKLAIQAPARADAMWVVDGQQRLATLAEALLREGLPAERSIYFELEQERYVYERAAKDARAAADLRLPVSVLLDSNRLLEWMFERPALPAELRGRAADAGKRIREYRVPAYIVESDDSSVLRTIFDRINRTGIQLDNADVFNALFGSLGPSRPADLAQVADEVFSMGFGRLDEDLILRSLRAIGVLPQDRDFTRALTPERAQALLKATETAVRSAVFFLRHDAGIPHVALLPYSLPVIVLSRYFHEFPEPHARSRLLLRRWLWRGSLGLQLGGGIIGLRQQVDCVTPGDEEGSVQRLLASTPAAAPREVSLLSDVRFDKARSKLQFCALASLGPRHLGTGAPLDLATLLSDKPEEQVRQLFASNQVGKPLAATLANRIIHPRPESGVLSRALLDVSEPAILAAHAISQPAHAALKRGDHAGFLAARSETLSGVVGRYFDRQAEWNADDSPSIASMIVEE
jgi:hypothetical protein